MILLFAAMLAGADPNVSPAPKTDTASAAVGAPVKEKKICRSEADIGSIVPKRTCRTAAQWKQIADAEAGRTRTELRSLNATPGSGPN